MEPGNWKIEVATEADVPILAPVLARALADEQILIWMFPDAEERRRILPWKFEANLRAYVRGTAQVGTDAGRAGVAVWEPEGADSSMSLRDEAREALACVRTAGLRRFLQAEAGMRRLAKREETGKRWELMALAVDPPSQGRGLGQSLMRPALARFDEEGVPAFAETTNERAVPFYLRLGFAVRDEVLLPDGPRVWCLRREPQPIKPMFRILLFAVLKDAAAREALVLPDDRAEMSVAELLDACARECPALAKYLPHVRVAVDLEYVPNTARVRRDQEIALIPPVAGGR